MAAALLGLISSLLLEVQRSFQSERDQERATEILRSVLQSTAEDSVRDELQQSQDQCLALISSVLAKKREIEQDRYQSVPGLMCLKSRSNG